MASFFCKKLFPAIAFLLLAFTVSEAQSFNNSDFILLRNEKLPAPENAAYWLDSLSGIQRKETFQAIIKFKTLPDKNQKKSLEKAGVHLLDYISENSFSAVFSLPLQSPAPAFSGIKTILSLKPEWKADPHIIKNNTSTGTGKEKILVSFIKQARFSQIEDMLSDYRGIIKDKKFKSLNVFEIEIPQNKISALAGEPLVKYISNSRQPVPLNYDARASSGGTYLGSPAATGGIALDGTGVTVGIGDISSAIYHVDVKDRIKNFVPNGPVMHGTHTTVTVAGKGIMDPKTKGIALSSDILAHFFDIVLAQTPVMYQNFNMTLTNNSYAAVVGDCDNAGIYDPVSQMLDELSLNYPEVLHVFSSGNDGLLQCGAFPTSFQTVTGGYQPAKNILTVGAMAKDNSLWAKSSRGPVRDGRLKPEIMAYGFMIYSGDNFDSYGPSNGTSMSCPVVTGGMALLEQRYKQLNAGKNAPAGLLKILAMNGATDFGNPGPDYTFGYGLLNVLRSVNMLEKNHYIIDSVSHGSVKNFSIPVPANTAALKIMLYWNDEPASPLASKALVNNLDLEVTAPAGQLHHPLILNPDPAHVNSPAAEGIDDLNNSEQVVIKSPATGNYTLSVKGKVVPSGNQSFFLVYDFVPDSIKIKNPVAGVPVPANDSFRIYWDAPENAGSFSLEYSLDNGGSWNIIDQNIPASERQYYWFTPDAASTQMQLRIKRKNTSQMDVTGSFVISPQPQLKLSDNQCPGYLSMEWTPVNGAAAYEVLLKKGADLVPVDTLNDTSYVFSGLDFNSFYYAGVRPLINGQPGFRSKSVKRMPFDGACQGTISNGDLKAGQNLKPVSGRLFTSSQLSTQETISFILYNLDDMPVNQFRTSWKINNGAWQSQIHNVPIPPVGNIQVDLPGADLSVPGKYQITVAVENLDHPDPVNANDTLICFVDQIQNPPVDLNLSFTDDFESLPAFSILKDTIGFSPNQHWDFQNSTDSGRLSSFISSDILISGERSLSLDLQVYAPGNQNLLTGTFNLQAYDTSHTEARLELDYKLHGKPKFLDGNEIWIRGSDTAPWKRIFVFDTTAVPGEIQNTGSLSITQALAEAGQNFSSSFQLRIGQHDTAVIAMNEYGNGMSLDNFRLYSVKNDVQLLTIKKPGRFLCNSDSVSVEILIYNSDNLPQDTVFIFSEIENGLLQTDTLLAIPPKDTVHFIFKSKFPLNGSGAHKLNVWIKAPGDTYPQNDSILDFEFYNQPEITRFPYLENFENGTGGWFSAGINDSWEFGQPASLKINQAASGKNAWKTTLSGNYNDNEKSWLYSPCFDITAMENPMLSFSLITDMEDCGEEACDLLAVQYSEDGKEWKLLESSGAGINWYTQGNGWKGSETRWRVASVLLPKSLSSLKLRFSFQSDVAANSEGVAVDDIHIFDFKYPVYDGNSSTQIPGTQEGLWKNFLKNDKITAQIYSGNNPAERFQTDIYKHDFVKHPVYNQYFLSRSLTVRQTNPAADNFRIRLYVSDEEIKQFLKDQSCDTCFKANDAYRLGIIKYDDPDKEKENGSLTDNVSGKYRFIQSSEIAWVPYEKGYYAETGVETLSEFWFGNRLPANSLSVITISPNPVTDSRVQMIWSAREGEEIKLILTDMTGRKVYENRIEAQRFDNKIILELPELSSGVYNFKYFSGTHSGVQKLLIKR